MDLDIAFSVFVSLIFAASKLFPFQFANHPAEGEDRERWLLNFYCVIAFKGAILFVHVICCSSRCHGLLCFII